MCMYLNLVGALYLNPMYTSVATPLNPLKVPETLCCIQSHVLRAHLGRSVLLRKRPAEGRVQEGGVALPQELSRRTERDVRGFGQQSECVQTTGHKSHRRCYRLVGRRWIHRAHDCRRHCSSEPHRRRNRKQDQIKRSEDCDHHGRVRKTWTKIAAFELTFSEMKE